MTDLKDSFKLSPRTAARLRALVRRSSLVWAKEAVSGDRGVRDVQLRREWLEHRDQNPMTYNLAVDPDLELEDMVLQLLHRVENLEQEQGKAAKVAWDDDYGYEYDPPIDESVTIWCHNRECPMFRHGETWHPTTEREYQGSYPQGGMVDFFTLDAFECPECGQEGSEEPPREHAERR